ASRSTSHLGSHRLARFFAGTHVGFHFRFSIQAFAITGFLGWLRPWWRIRAAGTRADAVVAGFVAHQEGVRATGGCVETAAHGRFRIAPDMGEQVLLDRSACHLGEVQRTWSVAENLDRSLEKGHPWCSVISVLEEVGRTPAADIVRGLGLRLAGRTPRGDDRRSSAGAHRGPVRASIIQKVAGLWQGLLAAEIDASPHP